MNGTNSLLAAARLQSSSLLVLFILLARDSHARDQSSFRAFPRARPDMPKTTITRAHGPHLKRIRGPSSRGSQERDAVVAAKGRNVVARARAFASRKIDRRFTCPPVRKKVGCEAGGRGREGVGVRDGGGKGGRKELARFFRAI